MSGTIILYDVPGYGGGEPTPRCFSFNVWKVRMALNYKKLPYKTEWTEFPDIAHKFRSLGLQPNQEDSLTEHYTCPAVDLQGGTMLMDSLYISRKLEEWEPEPSLHLDTRIERSVTEAVTGVLRTTWWDALQNLVENVMTLRSAAYFLETRERRFGASIAQLAKSYGGERAWKIAEASGGPMDQLKNVLTRYRADEGPFLLGSKPSYGDFIAASFFECYMRCHIASYERIMRFDQVFRDLHAACRPWLERDT